MLEILEAQLLLETNCHQRKEGEYVQEHVMSLAESGGFEF